MSTRPPEESTAAQTAVRLTDTLEEYLAARREELRKTTLVCDPSYIDGDLRQGAPEDRRQCGLPPKPDERAAPEQYRFWLQLFEPLPTFIDPDFTAFALRQLQRAFPVRTAVVRTSREGSRNWSGAYITPRDGLMFTGVYGTWRVPKVSRPHGAPSDRVYGSSTWIGLDGQRRYLDSSLPQIGTAQYLIPDGGSPKPTTWAWWQWWSRYEPAPPVELPLEVRPGDLMLCALIVVDETHVMFLIKNQDTGKMVKPFIKTAPEARMPDGACVQVRVSGATAEWVMEQPAEYPTGKPYELPNYDTVTLEKCFAVAAPRPGWPASADPEHRAREEKIETARLIRMYAVKEKPSRTLTISTAKRNGPHSGKTTYVPEASLQLP